MFHLVENTIWLKILIHLDISKLSKSTHLHSSDKSWVYQIGQTIYSHHSLFLNYFEYSICHSALWKMETHAWQNPDIKLLFSKVGFHLFLDVCSIQMLELRIWNFLSEFCYFLVFSSGSFSWILNLNAKLLFSELEANISMKSGFCIKYPWEMWSSNWQPDHSCRHLIPFQHTSFLLWSPLLQLTISLFYLTDNFQICLSFFDFSPPLCYFSIFSSSDTFA